MLSSATAPAKNSGSPFPALPPARAQAGTDAGAKGGEQAIGFRHVAFEVEHLEPMVESLRADNVDLDSIIDCGALVPGMRIVFFRDPEGNSVELMEGYRDEE